MRDKCLSTRQDGVAHACYTIFITSSFPAHLSAAAVIKGGFMKWTVNEWLTESYRARKTGALTAYIYRALKWPDFYRSGALPGDKRT